LIIKNRKSRTELKRTKRTKGKDRKDRKSGQKEQTDELGGEGYENEMDGTSINSNYGYASTGRMRIHWHQNNNRSR